MPRILPLQQFSEEIKTAHIQHKELYNGRITNMKATMSRSKLVFDTYMMWYPLYEQVKKITGERTAYLFAFAVSSGSNCPLCTTYFRKLIVEHGEKPEDLKLSAEEQQLLDFGSAVAENKGYINNEIYAPIKQRFSETEIVILVAFAGQMIATNIFNNVLEVEIDEYLAPYIKTPPNEFKS
ncbi:MAG: hypothetical protein U0V74_15115 [Chitinophagales bacterium]